MQWYYEFGDSDLPWRNTSNPWEVLLAGVLLRKTNTSQVLKIFKKVRAKYLSADAVLQTSLEEIANDIAPLGMSKVRARLLKLLAEKIKNAYGGCVPLSREDLMKLPGIGRYIAAEVLLVIKNERIALVDRNVVRVLSRVFGIKFKRSRPHTDPDFLSFADSLVPEDPALRKPYNYGVLDIGRKLCKQKKQKCNLCPLLDMCLYVSRSGFTQRTPQKD